MNSENKSETEPQSYYRTFIGIQTIVICVGLAAFGFMKGPIKVAATAAAQEERFNQYVDDIILDRSLIGALESSQDAFVKVDEKGIVEAWSAGSEKMFGIKREDAIGFGIGTMIPIEYRAEHRRQFEAAMGNGHRRSKMDCEALHTDGHRFNTSIELWISPPVGAIAKFSVNE